MKQDKLNSFILKRSKRKSLAISIVAGEVIVRAPLRYPMADIDRFIEQKRFWIAEKLRQQWDKLAEIPQRQYICGEVLPCLGEDLVLELRPAKGFVFVPQAGRLILSGPRLDAATVKIKLEQWYKQQALAVFSEKVRDLSQRSGIDYQKVRVRKTKSRWGHCTRDGVLQFNWLLLMAPEWVVDYVVAHELAHRVHFNHSPLFWQLVGQLNDDVSEAKAWLNQHGHTLVV